MRTDKITDHEDWNWKDKMRTDKITDHEDWKDGMNIFRSRVNEKIDGILEVLNVFKKEIIKLKQKENTT